MKKIILMSIAVILTQLAYGADLTPEYKDSTKTAIVFCSKDKQCVDVVSMELDGMYYQGLNETQKTTIGTLINRKDRELADYCYKAKDKNKCETYRNQLMLKYMTGLLER